MMESMNHHETHYGYKRLLVLLAVGLLFLSCSKEGEQRLTLGQKSKVTFDSIRTGIRDTTLGIDGSMNIYANVYNGSDFFITRIKLRILTVNGDRDFNMFVLIPPLSAGAGKIENCYPVTPMRYSMVDVYGWKKRPGVKKK